MVERWVQELFLCLITEDRGVLKELRRKCNTCLCNSCLHVCCDRKKCKGKIESCENYSGFGQMSIFNTPQEPQYQRIPRHPLKYYGLTEERVEELEKLIRSGGRYASMASQAAHRANKDISEYLIISIAENKSYDALEKMWARGEIERIPYGKTDFYGIRRYFFHIMNEEMRKIGK